jgi:hypothetical protein
MPKPKTKLTDPGPIAFEAVLRKAMDSGSACFVDFPHPLKPLYGVGNLVPVVVLWDGTVSYRGSLAMMGGDCAMLLCRTDVLRALGKQAGDGVHVRVELDSAPRVVELPEDAAAVVLADGCGRTGWEALSPFSRREFVDWIDAAKRPETRQRRIEQTRIRVVEGRRLKD